MFFSIIIPTYNRAHLIESTLDSVLNQTFKDFEVIIVDDGSTDQTKEVIEKYISDNKLNKFCYYYKPNGERGVARNHGIERAKGIWITFLDSDDLFYPNHLQLAFDFIKTHSEAQVIHSAYEFKTQEHKFLRSVKYSKDNNLNSVVLKGNLFSCFGMLIKAEVLADLKFEESRQLSGTEDWLLWLQIAARYPIYFQPQFSGCMIQHDGRSVLNFKEEELLNRTNLLIEKLIKDKYFINKYGANSVKKIEAHMLTYAALHLVLSRQTNKAVELFVRGVNLNPLELFSERTFAFIKHLLFS